MRNYRLIKSIQSIVLVFVGVTILNCCTNSEQRKPQEDKPDPNSEYTPAKPNILLILADDMGYGDVSNIGNKYLNTPQLDKLAEESVNFKNFYVSPVCAPTRASLLTGRYHQEIGVRSVTNGFEIMDPEAVTLAEMLKTVGYRTALFGKWHLGEYYPSTPNAQGFDEFLGFRTGHTSNYYDAILEHNGKAEQTRGYITDMFTRRAIQYMKKESEQPFFCYLAYNAPHSPLQIEESKFSPFLKMGLNEKTARVYAMVENIDENIGKVITFLKDEKLIENTIVIFMSDNGPISGWQVPQEKMRYNAGLRDQKFTTYEGGIRTQCYWMWKNKWHPYTDAKNIAAHIDVVPTVANLLNFELHDSLGIDGIDLGPALENKALLDTNRYFFEDYKLSALDSPQLFDGGIARKGKWKLGNGVELYNIEDDPGEKYDLAKKYPELLKELQTAYKSYYSNSYEASNFFPLPIKVGFWEENPVFIKAHHGKAYGNVKMMGFRGNYNERVGIHPTGVDGDWASNWKEQGDKMEWSLQFVENANYEIGITTKGSVGKNSCCFALKINDSSYPICLPGIENFSQWEYLPITKIKASEFAQISLNLTEISVRDSIMVNELVVTRLD